MSEEKQHELSSKKDGDFEKLTGNCMGTIPSDSQIPSQGASRRMPKLFKSLLLRILHCERLLRMNHLYHLHFPADSSATPKFVFVRSTSSAVPSYHTATVCHGPFGKPSLCQRTVVVLCVAGLHSNVVFESLCGIDNNQHNEHKNKTHLK